LTLDEASVRLPKGVHLYIEGWKEEVPAGASETTQQIFARTRAVGQVIELTAVLENRPEPVEGEVSTYSWSGDDVEFKSPEGNWITQLSGPSATVQARFTDKGLDKEIDVEYAPGVPEGIAIPTRRAGSDECGSFWGGGPAIFNAVTFDVISPGMPYANKPVTNLLGMWPGEFLRLRVVLDPLDLATMDIAGKNLINWQLSGADTSWIGLYDGPEGTMRRTTSGLETVTVSLPSLGIERRIYVDFIDAGTLTQEDMVAVHPEAAAKCWMYAEMAETWAVGDRAKPATRSRVKTGHFEQGLVRWIASPDLHGGAHGEPYQSGYGQFDSDATPTRLVQSTDCQRTERSSGHGGAVYPPSRV